MFHPLLHLITTNPQLLGEHAEAYAELVRLEIDKTTASWKSRVALYAMSLILFMVGAIFAGVALMLWAAIPTAATMHVPALLIVVPLVPLLAGGWFVFRARAELKYPAFDVLKQQLSADLAMLREVGGR